MTTNYSNQEKASVQQSHTKTVLLFGFLLGLVLCSVVAFRIVINMHLTQPVSSVDLIILIAGLFLFTFIYKRKIKVQSATFKKLFLKTLSAGVVATVIYSLFIIIYAHYIDTHFCNRYCELQEATFAKMNIASHEFAKKTEDLKLITPQYLGILSFILLLLWSSLFSAIVSLFMRTPKNK